MKYRSQLEVSSAMHTVYIYKSEVYILISMGPDLQSCKEEHKTFVMF